jgi:hypothetical protein
MVYALSDIQSRRCDLFINRLVYSANGAVLTLANKGGNFLGLNLEGIWITSLDGINRLVGEAVHSNDERRQPNLERFGELVGGARDRFRKGVGLAGEDVRRQDPIDELQWRRDHWNRGNAGKDGDGWRVGGRVLSLSGRHGRLETRFVRDDYGPRPFKFTLHVSHVILDMVYHLIPSPFVMTNCRPSDSMLEAYQQSCDFSG